MVAWSGIGMNYGHQAVYDANQTESDFTFLRSIGINRVRLVMPGFQSASIANCQDMVLRALAHGFYVVWGVADGQGHSPPNLTATIWNNFKTYVTGTLAPWAQANGLPEMGLGNEAELHADGVTLTAATVRSDVRAMASTVKAGGYTGKVSYSTSILSSFRAPWVSEGIGSLDYIAWNSYDTLTNFQGRSTAIVSAFGNHTYISEFSAITLGFADYNDESLWYTDVINRIASMQSAGVQAGYYFCYRDGGFGLTPDTWALVLSNGSVRSARDAIKNVVAPVYSALSFHR